MVRDPDKLLFELAPSRTPWQYSLRGLLIVTTAVSICLAVGIYFAGVLFVLGVMALIQAATLFAADWLIRPENRRALAAVSAGSWIILGSGLALIGGHLMYLSLRDNRGAGAWVFASGPAAAGLYCFHVATKRWRVLSGERPFDSHLPAAYDGHVKCYDGGMALNSTKPGSTGNAGRSAESPYR